MKFRTILLGITALFVAFNAAYFSVSGLSNLFAGATISVIIMASSLEIGKLIGASFLYNYWTKINKALRVYLTMAVFVLVLITSAGIYGYLTSAYQTTADQLDISEKRIELIELKKERYESQLTDYKFEKTQLTETINTLSKGLANNVIQYKDKETGQIITTTSVNTRRVLTAELNDSKLQRTKLDDKIEIFNDSITSYEIQILNLRTSDEISAEVGPLRFLSELLGWKMGTIVNILTLIIIFVFDPLAVVLIVAFNTALKVDRETTPTFKNDDNDEQTADIWKGLENSGLDKPFKLKSEDIEVVDEQIILDNNVKDINKDGIITERELRLHYEKGGWKDAYNTLPYYHHPWFDWKKLDRWVNDKTATNFWLKSRGGSQSMLDGYRSKYPTDFNSKVY